MHTKTILIMIGFILIPLSAAADSPQFTDYPVKEVYQGINHPVVPNKYFDNSFSERQTALKNQKVNYAGHYIVYTKQCGKDCITTYITDVKTGQGIIKLENSYNISTQYPKFAIEHKSDNNLLIISNLDRYPTPPPPYFQNKENIPSFISTYWILNKSKISKLNYYDFHQIEQNQADFQNYCQDLNSGKPFTSSSDFLCNYPHQTIKDIYKKLLNNSADARLLHYPLPKIGTKKEYNLKNDGDGLSIHYEWLSKDRLKIDIYQFSKGKTNYIITQDKYKTSVSIHTENPQNH